MPSSSAAHDDLAVLVLRKMLIIMLCSWCKEQISDNPRDMATTEHQDLLKPIPHLKQPDYYYYYYYY